MKGCKHYTIFLSLFMIHKDKLVQNDFQGRKGMTARFFPLRRVRFLVALLDADTELYFFKDDMALFLIGVGKFCRWK